MAQARARGEGELSKIAQRAADHVCATFGPGGTEAVCGHPQIESALVELARLTGRQRYLDQAALFVERRGHGSLTEGEFGRAYFQDDVPVRRATVLRGHAVRALYLAAGAVDVAVETGDDDLLAAVVRQWEAAVARRTYLTGGMGSHHRDESFGADFVLPPDRAYSETCSRRRLRDARLAAAARHGRTPLRRPRRTDPVQRGRHLPVRGRPVLLLRQHAAPAAPGRRTAGGRRQPPGGLGTARPLVRGVVLPDQRGADPGPPAGLPGDGGRRGVQLHQYADADIATSLTGGLGIALRVRTDYPSGGTVTVRIDRSPAHPWTLSLRVPAWAAGAPAWLVSPDGVRRPVTPGTTAVTRIFRPGDEIRLELPVAPRWIHADPRIDAVRGTVAVQRGPLVYCAESVDLPDGHEVDAIRVDTSADPEDGPGGDGTQGTGGTVVVAGEVAVQAGQSEAAWPYEPLGHPTGQRSVRPTGIVLVPYHAWADRGPSTMRVWLPTTAEEGRSESPDSGSDAERGR